MKGYPHSTNTWEKRTQFNDAATIKIYEDSILVRKPHSKPARTKAQKESDKKATASKRAEALKHVGASTRSVRMLALYHDDVPDMTLGHEVYVDSDGFPTLSY